MVSSVSWLVPLSPLLMRTGTRVSTINLEPTPASLIWCQRTTAISRLTPSHNNVLLSSLFLLLLSLTIIRVSLLFRIWGRYCEEGSDEVFCVYDFCEEGCGTKACSQGSESDRAQEGARAQEDDRVQEGAKAQEGADEKDETRQGKKDSYLWVFRRFAFTLRLVSSHVKASAANPTAVLGFGTTSNPQHLTGTLAAGAPAFGGNYAATGSARPYSFGMGRKGMDQVQVQPTQPSGGFGSGVASGGFNMQSVASGGFSAQSTQSGGLRFFLSLFCLNFVSFTFYCYPSSSPHHQCLRSPTRRCFRLASQVWFEAQPTWSSLTSPPYFTC